MSRREIRADHALVDRNALQGFKSFEVARRHPGHAHFWDRALSRRQLLKGSSVTAGVLTAGGWTTANAAVPGNAPKPIPGGFTFPPLTEVFHNFAPGVFDPLNTDRSGIFDFQGQIGYSIIDGTGTSMDARGSHRHVFETDLRFMQGTYIGVDGKYRDDTFVLI